MDKIPTPEWVKLIPADAIPVFCFNENTTERDFERAAVMLKSFFGEGKFLAIRGDVQISAITEQGVSVEGASWAMEGAAHATT